MREIAKCGFCGRELYVGQELVSTPDGFYCDDDCFHEYAYVALGYSRTIIEGSEFHESQSA